MTEECSDTVQSIATKSRAQARLLRVDAFLSFIYTADIVYRYLNIEMKSQPASVTGFSVLHALILSGGAMTPSLISKRVFRSKHAVTRVIDTLEKQGLVVRGPIGKDRRTRKVSITEKGLALVEGTMPDRRRISNTAFRTLDKGEVVQLHNILRKIREHLLGMIVGSSTK